MIAEAEGHCASESDRLLLDGDVALTNCFRDLGTTLSWLERFACCWWGCNGGDHVVERIVARTVSSARASVHLSRCGYYDEALSLARSVAEAANLFALWDYDQANFSQWKSLSASKRREKFGPGAVRGLLRRMGQDIPVDNDHYEWLCGIATHVTPHTTPQAFTTQQPNLGSYVQKNGLAIAIVEIAIGIHYVGLYAPSLSSLDAQSRAGITEAAEQLGRSVESLVQAKLTLWREGSEGHGDSIPSS
jgi:hypothetical protein